MTEIILDENEDWDNRILCIDEACIGTIGADGKCKECGKAYDGELPAQSHASNEQPGRAEDPPPVLPHENGASDDDWDNRVLCSDGACIGVIGPDGKCKECGQPVDR